VSICPFTSEELRKFDVSHDMSDIHTVSGAFDRMKTNLVE